MISNILKILKEKNVTESSLVSDYYYYFNNRANINLFINQKRGDKRSLFLKISDIRDYKETFDRMRNVYTILPHILPEPVCCFSLGKYSALVTKAYNIELIINKRYLRFPKRKILLDNVWNSIKDLQLNTMCGYFIFDSNFYEEKILIQANNFFGKWRDVNLLNQFDQHVEKLKKYFGAIIPNIPQHGDLGFYNIALIDGDINRIIFIDWDSYANVNLPMYDPLIFLRSFMKFFKSSTYVKSNLNQYIKEKFSNYCNNFGLNPNFVVDLYPICLILYSGLRTGIGIHVGQENAMMDLKQFFNNQTKFILNI